MRNTPVTCKLTVFWLRVESFDSENRVIYGSMVDEAPSVIKISLFNDDIIVAVATFR